MRKIISRGKLLREITLLFFNVDPEGGVGERNVAVVQNGKILINGTFSMSFSWRKFVCNLWVPRAYHLLSVAVTPTVSTRHNRLE